MIKKGIQVKILCGKDKGKKGEVIEILRNRDSAKVKGINIIKKSMVANEFASFLTGNTAKPVL